MNVDLTIGVLAKRGGVNVETIRYYQRRGLLREPSKPSGGFRKYASDSVNRVRFIKRAQSLGFTLAEILGLLELDEKTACFETRQIATHKLELIQQKLADLTRIKEALSSLLRSCDKSSSTGSCPIIDLLVQE